MQQACHPLSRLRRSGVWLLLEEIAAPAAEFGDVAQPNDRMGFDQEAHDLAAILDSHAADSKRGRDAGDEAAEGVRRESPYLAFDAGAFEAGRTQQAGSRAREGEEAIIRGGPAALLEP